MLCNFIRFNLDKEKALGYIRYRPHASPSSHYYQLLPFQLTFFSGIRESLGSLITMMHICRHTLFILLSIACLLDAALAASAINATYNTLDYVDPLIGTSNGGNVFAGATLPFGKSRSLLGQ